ncbi:type II secretion system protein GspM [uncultured Massilia sp.]|uniref:type II secretion system protein GspM n=1 Tax=uncultured Massilia sp. TaxID=169973 RepID=UPI0025F46C64|nr:type II secretion system protein GspM [uncultured Massilia sp.]
MTPKQRWQALSARVDALSPRERVLALAAVLAVVAGIGWMAALGPALQKQERLRAQIAQQRDQVAALEAETAQKLAIGRNDPDAPLRERLGAVRADTERLTGDLRAMQKGLVPPERVAPLLESILRSNARLKLVSMKTLPVGSLSDLAVQSAAGDPARPGAAAQAAAAAAAPAAGSAPPAVARAPDLLFSHGVELTLRGSYLDMVDYMTTLEALPTQLFWGKAQLEVEQYPEVRLTLTLYTLSLDPKWMKL